jgi:5-dehydro-2-deoxygluconokinase
MSAAVPIERDLVTIGRVSVDLYGQQIGTRLEDVTTFARAIGGCPANIAVGAARLGLKAALISRVGAEPMGRFVREQLTREGVDTRALVTDAARLTALVLLSVRDAATFPLIFYRENCADSALCEDDVDAQFIAASRAVLLTGTHFSIATGARAQRKAIAIARAHARSVVLDLDYRPNLWGIGGHDAGEARDAPSERFCRTLAPVLPDCDLIVGTEEELRAAAGGEDLLEALRHIRAQSAAVLVCKRGARGCVVFAGAIPGAVDEGLVVPGRAVEIYNVLGAGDAFLAGFLRGYLRGEPHETSARLANACGAIAVSRLMCSSEFPTLAELNHYLDHGSAQRALRQDARLNHLHWVTTRRQQPVTILGLSLDEDTQLAQLAVRLGAPSAQLMRLHELAVDAVAQVSGGQAEFGVLLAGGAGAAAPRAAAKAGLWIARAVEKPHSRPLEFEVAGSLAAHLIEWPPALTVSCHCQYHLGDPPELRHQQELALQRLASACRAQGRELMLGITAGQQGGLREDTYARVLDRLYQLQIHPEWWLLEPQASAAAWQHCATVIAANDAWCRGILLRVQAPLEEATRLLRLAVPCAPVRGFVAGGSIFVRAAQAWLGGQEPEEAAIAGIAERFRALAAAWSAACDLHPERAQRSGN